MKVEKTSALERALGHRFRRPELLQHALTHSSHAHEAGLRGGDGAPAYGEAAGELGDNEQLEFLGDAVLGFVTSQFLFEKFPHYHEGQLSKMRAHLVSAKHLVETAQRLQLGLHLRLGRGEEKSGGRAKAALLVNALEAVLAALYLDAGLEPARALITTEILEPELVKVGGEMEGGAAFTDHKSALQEMLQAGGRPQPAYSVVKEEGPEHNKRFTVEVRINPQSGKKDYVARAQDSTKKKAEQEAARQALDFLKRR